MPEDGWYQADIIPRRAVVNPRCQDCKTGGMFHPSHVGRRCPVLVDGDECQCGQHAPLHPEHCVDCWFAIRRQ